ncbi:hypothetical protein ACP4OV_029495 [Aristida adscensionis]
MEALSLIDVSAEDDLLLDLASPRAPPAPPPRPDPPHADAGSLVGAGASDFEAPCGSPAAADPFGVVGEQAVPERTESPKQWKAKSGVNLRKSLAWDSAFFTSEGVLDAEELAIVNSTFRKTQQGSRLPGISEEMRRSGESTTSTLDSESWAMESLETELFDNVRASIQRTLGKPNKAPGVTTGSSKPPKVTTNAPRTAARKVADRVPQSKIRAPVSTSQGVGGGKQRSQVTSKEPTPGRAALSAAAEAKPSSKPPRALPRVATMRSSTNTAITSGISGKRSSTGGVVDGQRVGKSANTSASVRPGGVTKSSSITKSAVASTFHGVLMDTKPDAKSKSAATLSNKNRTAQRVPVRPSSRADITKANPPRSIGNKIARGLGDRASPSISPSSSIDSMSSVVSGASTASTIGKMSYTSESMNILSPSLRKSNDLPPTTKLRTIVTEEPSSESAPSVDNSQAAACTTNQGKVSKPSGLRRPTPKIGYFDAQKSVDQKFGAQVQLQAPKILCPLPATPKSSSTQTMKNNSGQQESKSTASLHEASGAAKSKMVKEKPIDQNIGPRVQVQPMEILCSLPATPNCQPSSTQNMNTASAFGHQELKPAAVPHEQAGSVVPKHEPEKPIDQNIGPQVQLQPMEILCSLPATPNCQPSSTQNMNTASAFGHQELKPAAVPHEQAGSVVPKHEPEKPIDQNIGPQVQLQPMEILCSLPATPNCQPSSTQNMNTASAFGHQELKPAAVPHEQAGSVVPKHEPEKPIDQNIGPQVQLQPMEILCSLPATPNCQPSSTHNMNTASAFGHQEPKPAAVPHEQVPLKVVQMEVEPLKVAEHEACTHQASQLLAADTAKENIPTLHQNIQANVDESSVSVELLTQKLSSISLGEATPNLKS